MSLCTQCKVPLNESANFCVACGAKQAHRNWLAIFLTTLVGVWLFQQVVSTIEFALMRMTWDNPVSQIMWVLVGRQWMNNIAAFIILVALITVICVLGKWKVFWPAVAGYVFIFAWPMIGRLFDASFMLNSVVILAAQLTAALVTLILVRQHMKKVQQEPKDNWLWVFMRALVCVWMLQQVFGVINNLLWMQYWAERFSGGQTTLLIALFTIVLIIITLVMLIKVITKQRKWSVLWLIPVAYLLTIIAAFVLSVREIHPPAVQTAIRLIAAALTFILVRRHNKKTKNQPEPEQTMLT